MSAEGACSEEDPVVAKLLRTTSGLRAGGTSDHHEVLVTYCTHEGDQPFAFTRHGLLIDPAGSARYIPFAEIQDTSYYDAAMLLHAKSAVRKGERRSETLPIKLIDGEVIHLPLNTREDGMSERLTIARLLEQRVRIHRSGKRKAQMPFEDPGS